MTGLAPKVMKIKECNCFLNLNNYEANNQHNQHFSSDTEKRQEKRFLAQKHFYSHDQVGQSITICAIAQS